MPTPVRTLLRVPAAVAGGLALWLSFPEHDLWWLAPVGVALVAGATLTAGFRRGLGLGMLAGLAFFVPTLSWSGVYVGALPWLALATLEALYVAVMSGLVGFAGRRLLAAGRVGLACAVVPLGWVAQEWARSNTPYGGFPWARLAFSQADGPMANVAYLLGAPGLTWWVAAVGATLLYAVLVLVRGPRPAAAVALLVVAASAFVPGRLDLPVGGRTATVAFVQGNVPQAGLEFNAQRRAVLDNHVRGTLELAERAPADLTLVVWPENASDIDPFRNADADAEIRAAQQAVGVPLVVGAVLAEPPGANSNVSLFYTGDGPPQRYTKLHPVPFAEYIPHRAFFAMFTSAANLAGNFVAGHEIGVFDVPAADGPYRALPTICFEVAYDQLMRDSVAAAGDTDSVLLVQTNNATFGYTDESEQQFAISRIRAIEHGRSVVHVSTVGVSGFIAPDGTVTEKTSLFTADQRVAPVVLRHEQTPSDRMGPWPEVLLSALFVVLVITGAVLGRPVRVRRTPSPPSREDGVA